MFDSPASVSLLSPTDPQVVPLFMAVKCKQKGRDSNRLTIQILIEYLPLESRYSKMVIFSKNKIIFFYSLCYILLVINGRIKYWIF